MPKQNQNRPKRRFFCEKYSSLNNVRLVQRRSRVRVAHFSFKIALSGGAIMLTLLLVCSFSPRVHSIPRGPRILLHEKPSSVATKNPNFNRNYFKGVQLKVGGGAF